MEQKKKYQNVVVKKLPKSEVEIEAEITAEALAEARATALEQIKKTLEVPGFRAGHAPEHIVVRQVGDMKILEQAASIVLESEYGNIVGEHNIRAIGMPKITITKLAPGNPMGFKAITAVLPEISLSNYTEIAREEFGKDRKDTEKFSAGESVEESEIDKVIEDLKKTEGEKFKDADNTDLRKKIKENLEERKKMLAEEKRRLAVAEKMIAKAAIELPDLLIESELDTMINQLRADIERTGLTFEGYLEQIKKKEEDIRNDWRKSAGDKAALQLILNHIARTENIKPDEARVKQEMEHILSHHKGADRFRVRMYVENLLTNEAVFQFLLGAAK